MRMNADSQSGKDERYDKARRRLVIVWTWVGILLLGAAVLYLSGVIANAIAVIVLTAIVVFILRGPVNWLDEHGVNRTVGTVLAYVLFVAVIALLLFIMFSPVFGIREQFEDLVNKLPTYVMDFQTWVTDMYNQYAAILQSNEVRDFISNAINTSSEWLQTIASSSASGVIAAGASLTNFAMCFGFALVIAFWMLIELPNLGREANRLISDKRKPDAEMLHVTVTRVMGGYLRATIIQCGIIGLACGVLFAILDVPSPAAFGVITGVLNIIPIVGPWLGGGLAFAVSIPTSAVTGVIALIGTIVIQQLVYTFVSPKLMGDSVDIHPALTFIALMAGSGVGAALGGLAGSLVGALLSIPLTAMAKSIFVYYFEKKTGRRIVAPDGVFFRGDADEGVHVDPIGDATAPVPQTAPITTGPLPFVSSITEKLPIGGQADEASGASSNPSDEDGAE